MKVVIAAQKRFGLDVLQLCENFGCEIIGVIMPIEDKCVQPYVVGKGYDAYPPVCIDDIWNTEFDLGITAHYFGKVPQVCISRAKFGWLGYHPSLLPRHRGPSAIEWAKRMNDPVIGGSLYWLNENWDEGDIAYQDWMWLDHDKSVKELWDDDLRPLGLKLFAMALRDLQNGVVNRISQEPLKKFATYEPNTLIKSKV